MYGVMANGIGRRTSNLLGLARSLTKLDLKSEILPFVERTLMPPVRV